MVGGITVHDQRNGMSEVSSQLKASTSDMADKFYGLHLEDMRTRLGVEGGCAEMRRQNEISAYLKYQKETGNNDFGEWREREEAARVCKDPLTPEAFTLLLWSHRAAHSDEEGVDHRGASYVNRAGLYPIGGVLVYNVRLLGKIRGVESYEAMFGPLCPFEIFLSTVSRLLDRSVNTLDRDGRPLRFQLERMIFPILEVKNRWDVKYNAEESVRKLLSPHTVTYSDDGSQRYLSLVERV